MSTTRLNRRNGQASRVGVLRANHLGSEAPNALANAELRRYGCPGSDQSRRFFAREDGRPFPIGVTAFEDSMMTMWRAADDLDSEVVELPPDMHVLNAKPGRGPDAQPPPIARREARKSRPSPPVNLRPGDGSQ